LYGKNWEFGIEIVEEIFKSQLGQFIPFSLTSDVISQGITYPNYVSGLKIDFHHGGIKVDAESTLLSLPRLNQLESLMLVNCKSPFTLSEEFCISKLPNLQSLTVHVCKEQDISFLKHLTTITYLNIKVMRSWNLSHDINFERLKECISLVPSSVKRLRIETEFQSTVVFYAVVSNAKSQDTLRALKHLEIYGTYDYFNHMYYQSNIDRDNEIFYSTVDLLQSCPLSLMYITLTRCDHSENIISMLYHIPTLRKVSLKVNKNFCFDHLKGLIPNTPNLNVEFLLNNTNPSRVEEKITSMKKRLGPVIGRRIRIVRTVDHFPKMMMRLLRNNK